MEKKSGRTPREGIAAVNFNDIVPIGQAFDLDDTHVDVLGQKIVISVHRAKNTVTKIEGIPAHFSLEKLRIALYVADDDDDDDGE